MRRILTIILLLYAVLTYGQITIGGNVYGGGNIGNTGGKTEVVVCEGDIEGNVFGGARQANVGGSAFVHIDGAHMSGDILINEVYGGNDVAGTIGTSGDMPAPLTETTANGIDNTYNAFVLSTKERTVTTGEGPGAVTTQPYKIYIGQLFGGGNGDYDYDSESSPYRGMTRPELGKTYLEIRGGSCVLLYGGGNNATVTEATDICIDNPSAITYQIYERNADGSENTSKPKLTDARLKSMGVYQLGGAGENVATSSAYQFSRVFGGNNKAPMAIRPSWHLKRGKIRNLYSGGNQGAMTHENGILLTIQSEDIEVGNVYGGCRMSDVNPARNNIHAEIIDGVFYPKGYSARLYITAGNIGNVYGGNDISGIVYGGNAVGIHCNIKGDIYGGGNGSYPYTDNPAFQRTKENTNQETVALYGDYYYNPDKVLEGAGVTAPSGATAGMMSALALTEFRPHAESVCIRVSGADADHPVIIGGSIFCGGNSATLRSADHEASAELKIGSHVIADKVFLGSNGENMITEPVLRQLSGSVRINDTDYDFSQMDLTQAEQFEAYIKGCEMQIMPGVLFDNTERGDPDNYTDYTSFFGSFYCGGNVGSVYTDGLNDITFNHKVIIFDKLVGGSNNANIAATDYNAAYHGGLLGPADAKGNKLRFNLSGLKLQPKRWKDESNKLLGLEWNTWIGDEKVSPNIASLPLGTSSAYDNARRFMGANIYGGCYASGHVNGNVIINLDGSIVDIDGENGVFDSVLSGADGEDVTDENDNYTITQRRTGVIRHQQGMDVNGQSLNVFGAGYGEDSEIWGSTTVNLNEGYTFQIFAGGEKGAVGKKNDQGKYYYSPDFSTTVNLRGIRQGQVGLFEDLAECEFIYGGGFEGVVAGNTQINLGNGRIFNSFGGSCNADVLGHTETYIGRSGVDANGDPILGFPYIREHIYAGNDLGGHILGSGDFSSTIRPETSSMIYGSTALNASAYIEFIQGRVMNIYGGCYGIYDYTNDYPTIRKPFLDNAFVNIHPVRNNASLILNKVFGAGDGFEGERSGDRMQNRSYIHIDIPDDMEQFKNVEVYGAGSYDGLGVGVDSLVAANPATADRASAIIDLISGQIDAVYGASLNEGFTRRTVVNVPVGSTIRLNNIFGGGYGLSNDSPCDVYEAHVNYASRKAQVRNAIYGGNNNARRTLYGFVNISDTVYSNKEAGYQATVYGAGYGENTWSQYTEVNLNEGAVVYEVYGGGNAGKVLNKASVAAWKASNASLYTDLPKGFTDYGLLSNSLVVNALGNKTNTNVNIHRGATVIGYCYGGGLGETATVSGTTFIGLLGGVVQKDLYAGGTSGGVLNAYESKGSATFTATANAYIMGGSVRNVYGGGWKGSVGRHEGSITAPDTDDVEGETNVVIGIRKEYEPYISGYGYYRGVPVIQRNAYGGGEGGAVYGSTNLTLNNGYIGYFYRPEVQDDPATEIDDRYEEKLHDETWSDHIGLNRLVGSGNVFGGGYIDNSSVDSTHVKIYGGYVRNSVFGGGEIAAIGRGTVIASGYQNSERSLDRIYKYGSTRVEIYNGRVLRDVYGGGKGYNNLGEVGTLYTDGYVFGQTEVYVRGGEIGTSENYKDGYGNVFGGGDLGYVYGRGTRDEEGERPSPAHYYYKDAQGNWTEDCKVVIEPYAQVLAAGGVTIGSNSYEQFDYVPTDDLNRLKGKDDDVDKHIWQALDDHGVIIRNAVFGGGNIAVGSDKVYANTPTVFGNVTASLRDVYRRDLITIGTEHIGGLYGGGNLSLVDGYRELHISNYGTDYYGLKQSIEMDEYDNLTERERAYFRLRFTCQKDFDGGKDEEGIAYQGHKVGDQIYEDEYNDLPDEYKSVGERGSDNYWYQDGFCSIYAGRLLNTLQRADFVGVFGSRMVLQGARDRVTSVVDYNRYTINRVGELSLMKMDSPAGETDDTNKSHGNYFGIYSIVNRLGNMTSDVLLDDVRQSDTPDTDDHTTYYQWKAAHPNSRKRNTATSHNEVALASGVFLELTTENSTEEHKEYGYITGVVELDLMNAKADAVGGGYVYAKNEHGLRSNRSYNMVTLSDYNDNARTYKMYQYSNAPGDLQVIQTSGNFVHGSKKTIIDDCYPHNMEYDPETEQYSEAHYWYVRGSIYIYDQVISAYTGEPNAYTRETQIPLTITAGSHGQLKLVNVQPSRYAYYENYDAKTTIGEEGIKVGANGSVYKLNDVISFWDWSQLPENEKRLFVPETMVSVAECSYTLGGSSPVTLPEGSVKLPADYDAFKASLPVKEIDGVNVHYVHDVKKDIDVAVDDIFHSSNNISHQTGYVVSFVMDTPPDWNDWYTRQTGTGTISKAAYDALTVGQKTDYKQGPTYRTSESGVYGQRHYDEGEIIPQAIVTNYHDPGTSDQATVTRAYVTNQQVSYTYGGQPKTINAGTAIPETEWAALDAATQALFKSAKMCISTLRLNEENYVIYGDLLNEDQVTELAAAFPSVTASDINAVLTNAYICESGGMYGGTQYSTGTNYSALEGWAALNANDRASDKFTFNHDGFDVLIDPDYQGDVSRYGHPYDETKPVEYTAIYNLDTPLAGTVLGTITKDQVLSREEYEQLANEKSHYTPITIGTTATDGDDYYIAKTSFSRGNIAYAKGQVINTGTYRALTAAERAEWVTVIRFTNRTADEKTYYYCREDYEGSTAVTNHNNGNVVLDATTVESGSSVKAGWVINQDDYSTLKNEQRGFIIKGKEPIQRSTLYVSRESNIHDLSKEKIISVVYQYTYNEGNDDEDVVNLVNELHIVNIHLQFESGAPIVDQLLPPQTVLPGTRVGLNQPKVTPGAYELIGGGWEIYDNHADAEFHRNGKTYRNNETPMYWYQDGYYVAYYAKSYIGKTYSNPVQFSVANYHDMKAVMDDKEHHYYVDNANVKRDAKIYISDYSADGENGLDILSDFFKLSHGTALTGHAPLDSYVSDCENLEFFLRSDLDHGGSAWTPIANNSGECFSGTLHGDGHRISGLSQSLFNHLCGNVYNLGVTGSFTGAGIAETGTGYMENCWIKTTGTPTTGAGHYALFGNPSRTEGGLVQVENCYYPISNAYTEPTGDALSHGKPRKMPDHAFYNGEVTYNLNGFYLKDRYDRARVLSGSAAEINDPYVTSRFSDGDFVYASGYVPDDNDRRYSEESGLYTPIWPDDYLYFGQRLNYGFVEDASHQALPSTIIRQNDYVVTTNEGNRVLRAPAYFRSSQMQAAHFNPYAVFAQNKKDEASVIAYKGLTALDFTGSNDDVAGGFKRGLITAAPYTSFSQGAFYPPILDDCGLTGMVNANLTQNLLVYTAAPDNDTAAGKTGTTVSNYLDEDDYAESADGYRTVAMHNNLHVHGHWVTASASGFTAQRDHFLVDKQDFNAPLAYTFDADHRMWYQRLPELFVDRTKGWDGISLPFTAELVTTHQKGELTHFFEGSTKGHEYWLRELTGIDATGDPIVAKFTYPAVIGSEPAKEVENTFLWDYYYEATSGHDHRDQNNDAYQTYYNDTRSYEHYPQLQRATPYIIGLPGTTYYEFDLSGAFQPTTTALPLPSKLSRQYVSFVSATGTTIGVSDDEMAGSEQTQGSNKYTFKPSYLNMELNAGEGNYVLSADGSQYNNVSSTPVELQAFRPYFVKSSGAGARRAITFSQELSDLHGGEEDNESIDRHGCLLIEAKHKMIAVTSTLREAVPVTIINAAGQTIATFTIQPGETINTRVNTGVYIVNKKKLIIK